MKDRLPPMFATDPRATELALLGGAPSFKTPLYVIKPALPQRDILDGYIDGIYDRKVLTNQGQLAKELEQQLAKLAGTKHAVLVSSATIGLQILFRALGLKGEVIVPSFTFIASAHSLSWEGITPVFADIEPTHLTLAPQAVEKLITSKTSAILGVHIFGNLCDIDALTKIAAARKIHLLFDSAQALGSIFRGTPIGSFGTAEVFSLHATKIINTGEGGFISTNDSELARRLELMRNFGFSGYDLVESLGTNGKVSEFNAALGLGTLPQLEGNMEENRKRHAEYKKALSGIPGITFLKVRPECTTNASTFPIFINDAFGLIRDELCAVLWKENVIARRYYYPGCHRQAPYVEAGARTPLTVTEAVSRTVLCLPCFPDLDQTTINSIATIIRKAHEKRTTIKAKFATTPITDFPLTF